MDTVGRDWLVASGSSRLARRDWLVTSGSYGSRHTTGHPMGNIEKSTIYADFPAKKDETPNHLEHI